MKYRDRMMTVIRRMEIRFQQMEKTSEMILDSKITKQYVDLNVKKNNTIVSISIRCCQRQKC